MDMRGLLNEMWKPTCFRRCLDELLTNRWGDLGSSTNFRDARLVLNIDSRLRVGSSNLLFQRSFTQRQWGRDTTYASSHLYALRHVKTRGHLYMQSWLRVFSPRARIFSPRDRPEVAPSAPKSPRARFFFRRSERPKVAPSAFFVFGEKGAPKSPRARFFWR